MSILPSERKNEAQQKPACELVAECSYSKGCACRDVKDHQCAALPADSNLLEICREAQPQCSAKMYFGYTTIICMCMKRQRHPVS